MDPSKLGIGHIIETEQQCDAIHMAIAPVEAGDRMSPGEHIGMLNGRASYAFTPHIGVVDPFLRDEVREGSRFWLFLYPGSITGLRHEWNHPAFAQKQAVPASERIPSVTTAKSDSERWMREWAVEHMGADYYGDHPMSESVAFERAIRAGETMSVGSNEDARDGFIDSTWWNHWETITGKTGDHKGFFRCAC